MLTIIVAKSRNNVIGMGNTIPWHLPADLKHFKKVTQGHTVIMGRLTWESLPKRPLPGRRNLVITSSSEPFEGAECFPSLDKAIEATQDFEQVFIIGGEQLYRYSLPFVDQVIVSEVDIDVEGDRFFPDVDKKDFTEIRRLVISDTELPFEVVTYERNKSLQDGEPI